MIPLVFLTFILAIKGAAAQNATDTNQVRSVQCRRYGTYDIIYIWQYMWHCLHFVTYMWHCLHFVTYMWHENWPGHWRIHHLHRLSGLCLRHLDLFCLQVFPALCFVLCVNLFSTWYNARAQYLFSTDIFVLSLCEASFLLSTKKLLRASVMLVEPQYCVNLHYISFKKKLNFLPHLRSTKRVVLAPTVLNALLCFVKFEWHSFSQHWSWSWPGRVLASRISLPHAQSPSYLIHVPEITYI